MIRSDTIDKIAPALLKAQTQIGAATKGAVNPHFKKSFASLGDVMEACKVALNEQMIAVLQPVGHDERGQYVDTVLLHASGQFISDRMTITCAKENDPQAQGSAVTYARRYGLQSMLFIPAEDDDAEGSMNRGNQSRPTTQQKQTTSHAQTPDNDFP